MFQAGKAKDAAVEFVFNLTSPISPISRKTLPIEISEYTVIEFSVFIVCKPKRHSKSFGTIKSLLHAPHCFWGVLHH